MSSDTQVQPPSETRTLDRRKFLLVSGLSAAGAALGVLNVPEVAGAIRTGLPRGHQPILMGVQNQAPPGDSTFLEGSVDNGPALSLANSSLTSRSSALFVGLEGQEYQRSGIWVRSNATKVDTVVGLFVENEGQGDGIYVENTKASSGASGVAIVNRATSIGLNCLHDSKSTFFQILKEPTRNDADFGDLLSFKDTKFGPSSQGSNQRLDERLFFIGGDCRLRIRAGIGNAEGIQVKRNETVASGASSIPVTLPVAEPDVNYGIVATPFWNTTVYVSDKTNAGFKLNFGTTSPGSEVSWIVFRDTL